MGLGLQTDTDMLDGTREHSVGDTSESSGGVILSIAEVTGASLLEVPRLESSSSVMKAAELDRDASTDAYQWSQGTLVERKGAFVFVDLCSCIQGSRVLLCCL